MMLKSLIILLILLSIPIVKADGCGIVCPTVEGGFFSTLFARVSCGLGTWFMCHAIAFVLVIIFVIGIFVFYMMRSEETRKKIGIYAKVGFIILILIIFYPSIKALLFTSPFIPPSLPGNCTDSCNASPVFLPFGFCQSVCDEGYFDLGYYGLPHSCLTNTCCCYEQCGGTWNCTNEAPWCILYCPGNITFSNKNTDYDSIFSADAGGIPDQTINITVSSVSYGGENITLQVEFNDQDNSCTNYDCTDPVIPGPTGTCTGVVTESVSPARIKVTSNQSSVHYDLNITCG